MRAFFYSWGQSDWNEALNAEGNEELRMYIKSHMKILFWRNEEPIGESDKRTSVRRKKLLGLS